MQRILSAGFWCCALTLALTGCQDKPAVVTPNDPEAEIRRNLATLGPDEQALAERQRNCPFMPETRLGEMGPPQKVTVQGETVFVCCNNCSRFAQEEPEQAAAQLKAFRTRSASK